MKNAKNAANPNLPERQPARPKRNQAITKLAMLICMIACVFLVGCSSYDNPAKTPLSSKACEGEEYKTVVSAFEEAGFTRVQTVPVETENEEEAGIVIEVSVGQESSFKKGKTMEGTSPVQVTYYLLVEKAAVPFAETEAQGRNFEQAVKELEAAGFTNITTAAITTEDKQEAGKVTSVTISRTSGFDAGSRWNVEAPITVTYYKYVAPKLQATANITESGESGLPVFHVETNLPDGTVLDLVLENDESYMSEQSVVVQSGQASSEPFANDGVQLEGPYTLNLYMRPNKQPVEVQEIIGADGENLDGDLIKQDTQNGKAQAYVFNDYSYISIYSAPLSEKEMLDLITEEIAARFGNDYDIDAGEDGYTINVCKDGMALVAALAKQGYKDCVQSWNTVVRSVQLTSVSIELLLEENGHAGKVAVINLLNDENRQYALLTVWDGMVIFNCIE